MGVNMVYVVQRMKPVKMCLSTEPGDIVLDPTCGSGTAAVVAFGRRWITIDTSRVAIALLSRIIARILTFFRIY